MFVTINLQGPGSSYPMSIFNFFLIRVLVNDLPHLFQLLLVLTSFSVGVGMLMLAAWFYLTSIGVVLPSWMPVLAMCLAIFADAAGFQPVSYIIITDLFVFQVGDFSTFESIFKSGFNLEK